MNEMKVKYEINCCAEREISGALKRAQNHWRVAKHLFKAIPRSLRHITSWQVRQNCWFVCYFAFCHNQNKDACKFHSSDLYSVLLFNRITILFEKLNLLLRSSSRSSQHFSLSVSLFSSVCCAESFSLWLAKSDSTKLK